MNDKCPNCHVSFQPEPGFYFGAMYITYGFNTALIVAFGLALYVWVDLPEALYLTLIALMAVMITPFSFRASRVLWLYWFGGLKRRE
jgi:hypothetical protein